jgi:hypothetical protein
MRVPFGRAVLTLDDTTKQIRQIFAPFTDPCRGKNTRYPWVDAGLRTFSVFFMQRPSLLEDPRRLDQPVVGPKQRPDPVWGPSDPVDRVSGKSPLVIAVWRTVLFMVAILPIFKGRNPSSAPLTL